MGNSLSQEEINAMLKNMSGDSTKKANGSGAATPVPSAQDSPGKSVAEQAGKMQKPLVQRVEFPQLKPLPRTSLERPKRKIFYNIPLILSGELGKAELTVRDLLELEEGSIVKLDKMAGESATVLVNDQYLGQAEIVVVNDRFGLRITAVGKEKAKEEKEEEKGRPGQAAGLEEE